MNALNDEYQQIAANSICHAANSSSISWQEAAHETTKPHILLRPKLFIDGNKWCALYGDNIQDGVCGFGDSPELAMINFNKNYYKKL